MGANPLELGSYRADLRRRAAGEWHCRSASCATSADRLPSKARVTLTPPNAYLVQGFITGRSAEAERLVREITLGAPPDASGRSAFSFEGYLLADVDFPPGREQREIQPGAHRLRSQLARQVRVARELRRVAHRLRIQERGEIAALVRAGLEVHHPARAVLRRRRCDRSPR